MVVAETYCGGNVGPLRQEGVNMTPISCRLQRINNIFFQLPNHKSASYSIWFLKLDGVRDLFVPLQKKYISFYITSKEN